MSPPAAETDQRQSAKRLDGIASRKISHGVVSLQARQFDTKNK